MPGFPIPPLGPIYSVSRKTVPNGKYMTSLEKILTISDDSSPVSILWTAFNGMTTNFELFLESELHNQSVAVELVFCFWYLKMDSEYYAINMKSSLLCVVIVSNLLVSSHITIHVMEIFALHTHDQNSSFFNCLILRTFTRLYNEEYTPRKHFVLLYHLSYMTFNEPSKPR